MKYFNYLFSGIISLFLLINSGWSQDTTLTVTSEGNVGIGMTHPAQKLVIDGFMRITDKNRLMLGGPYSGEYLYNPDGSSLRLHIGDDDRITFSNNGNIGIGLTDPAEKLQVNGMVYSASGGFKFPDGSVQLTAAGNDTTPVVSNTLDGAYDQGGPGAGRTITADAGAFEVDGVDGVLFGGTYNSGKIPAEGRGVRMMWYPGKAAFRTGFVNGKQWDEDSIGIYSVAMGYNTTASGYESIALGLGTKANSYQSIALGSGTKASGNTSLATGYTSTASGSYSTAMGFYTVAKGYSSTAMGYHTTASDGSSTAMGNGTTASGQSSTAMGYQTTADDYYSTAMGYQTTASGQRSTAMGSQTSASGLYSTTMGQGTTASGQSSTAMGQGTTASGFFSTAMGQGTTASGQTSTAMGQSTTADSYYSTAMGNSTLASGQSSTAMGYHTTASGDVSTAMGSYVNTSGKGAMIIGDQSTTVTLNSSVDNRFTARFANGFYLYTHSLGAIGAALPANGNSWVIISDSTKKENFKAVNGEQVLNKISRFKLTSWNYKGQDKTQFRHYGPMAQDFYNAFGHDGVGVIGNDTTIASADFAGINFVAIQALEKRTRQNKDQIEKTVQKTTELEKEIKEIKKLQSDLVSLKKENNELKQKMEVLLTHFQGQNKTNVADNKSL